MYRSAQSLFYNLASYLGLKVSPMNVWFLAFSLRSIRFAQSPHTPCTGRVESPLWAASCSARERLSCSSQSATRRTVGWEEFLASGIWTRGQRGSPWLQVAEALEHCTLSLCTKTTRTGRDAFWSHPSSTEPHGRKGP